MFVLPCFHKDFKFYLSQDMQAISDIHSNIMLLLAHTEWYSYEDKSNLHTERMRSHTILLNILQQVISNMPGNIYIAVYRVC